MKTTKKKPAKPKAYWIVVSGQGHLAAVCRWKWQAECELNRQEARYYGEVSFRVIKVVEVKGRK